jgi:hypothetical protein
MKMFLKKMMAVKEATPWITKNKPPSFYQSITNQREYFNWLGAKLNFCDLRYTLHLSHLASDWYNISREVIYSNEGRWVADEYNGVPSVALLKVYPEHDWAPWKFAKIPPGVKML